MIGQYEIPPDMDLHIIYPWAIVYIEACVDAPFVKVPVFTKSPLRRHASDGLTDLTRFNDYEEHLIAGDAPDPIKFKVFMLCGEDFFAHATDITDLSNAFFYYLRAEVDPSMARETAYAMCTAVFPPTSLTETGIHALLTLSEVKYITKDPKPLNDIAAIRLYPHLPMHDAIVK